MEIENKSHLERTAAEPRQAVWTLPPFPAYAVVNLAQALHKVILKRVDEVNDTIRVLRLEIPDRGSIRVTAP